MMWVIGVAVIGWSYACFEAFRRVRFGFRISELEAWLKIQTDSLDKQQEIIRELRDKINTAWSALT